MNEFIASNWPFIAVGVLLALVVLWWIVAATRRTRVSVDRRDTLDEGAARAARNQALIDAAPAATVPVAPIMPGAPGISAALNATVDGAATGKTQRESHVTSAPGEDDLTRIKGLGPKLAATLADLGVTRFAQIADWTDTDIDRIDAQLGRFQGRIRRDSWVEQAKYLAAGDIASFQQRFGAR